MNQLVTYYILCRQIYAHHIDVRDRVCYARVYILMLLRGIVVPQRNWMLATVLSFRIFSPFCFSPVERRYFVLEYVRDEIPSELREKVCR